MDAGGISDLDLDKYDSDEQVKIICLGDSAVGKSKYALCVANLFISIIGKVLFS